MGKTSRMRSKRTLESFCQFVAIVPWAMLATLCRKVLEAEPTTAYSLLLIALTGIQVGCLALWVTLLFRRLR